MAPAKGVRQAEGVGPVSVSTGKALEELAAQLKQRGLRERGRVFGRVGRKGAAAEWAVLVLRQLVR